MTVGNLNSDIAVGLSDPSNTRNRKEMLELVNRLRDTGYVVPWPWFPALTSMHLECSNRY
jgi:hypothetical protein